MIGEKRSGFFSRIEKSTKYLFSPYILCKSGLVSPEGGPSGKWREIESIV
jgi:hypothetical protein